MAGIIVADTIQSGGSFIRLNSASQTVATINASGIYANTGNLLIAANGTIGVASITNTAITGTITQAQIGNGVTSTGPAFSAGAGSSQSISSGVWTKMQINTEEFDTASCYDNSTNYRFTPNVAGYYRFNGNYDILSGSPTRMIISIYKNGSEFKRGNDIGVSSGNLGGGAGAVVTALIYMNGTTDYVELYCLLSGGGSLVGSVNETYFQGNLVRAA